MSNIKREELEEQITIKIAGHLRNYTNIERDSITYADDFMQLIDQYTEGKVDEAVEYQTDVRLIRTLNSGQEIWGAAIAHKAKQIYGDFAGSEAEAQAKLDKELASLKAQLADIKEANPNGTE